ncbi:MAG TPA: hypothetical protein VFL12_13890 [Thermoanaerobaculia bacterium]|nr:hypothetical protein [Thermoanaerobaculia bacterium]
MGLALAAIVELAALAVGAQPGPAVTFVVAAALAVLAIVFVRRRPVAPEEKPGRADRAALWGAAVAVAVSAIVALSEPMWSNDFFAIWGFKGKTIFLAHAIPGRLFHDPASAWSHPEYPLWLPAVFAALSAAIGRWDGQALAVLFPVLQATTAAALYGWGKRRFSASAGAVAALLAAAFFPLYQAYEVGMAELPLTFGLVLFASAALDFGDAADRAAASRLALSAFLAASVKQEGTLFVLLTGVVLAFRNLRLRRPALPVLSLTLAPAVLHELLLTAFRGRIVDRDFDWTLARPDRWAALFGRIGDAAGALARSSFVTTVIVILALAGFALLARPAAGSPALALLGPVLVVQGAVYLAVCGFSAFDPLWQVRYVPRLLRVLFPVLLLALLPRIAWVTRGKADRVASR